MDEKERAKQIKKHRRKQKRKKAGKAFLLIISIIVIGLAAFLVTLKICDPEFKIKSIIPEDKAQQVVSFVKEDILKQTTTTTEPTTKPTTTRPPNYDYVEFSDFGFDTSLQGNQVGNLLNNTNGAVTFSSAYIYYSIAGDGIYRFEPNNESNARIRTDKFNFICLNVLGDFIYYVDSDTNTLIKSRNSGGDNKDIAENISFAYLYNDKIYFIGSDNTVGYITTDDLQKTVLYTAGSGKRLEFVGISLSRIFFTQYDDSTKRTEYITISLKNKGDRKYFRNDTTGNSLINLQLENGYFYYYLKQTNGSYNLIRQKFGSEKVVTLATECSLTDYPVIYSNRLYYTELSNSVIRAKEINMNSMDEKIMLNLGGADSTTSAGVGFGYQYVFIFGKPTSDKSMEYRGSNIYTSSSSQNTIAFGNGGWYY